MDICFLSSLSISVLGWPNWVMFSVYMLLRWFSVIVFLPYPFEVLTYYLNVRLVLYFRVLVSLCSRGDGHVDRDDGTCFFIVFVSNSNMQRSSGLIRSALLHCKHLMIKSARIGLVPGGIKLWIFPAYIFLTSYF